MGVAVAQVAEAKPGEVGEGEKEDYRGYHQQDERDEGAGDGAQQGADSGGGGAFGLGRCAIEERSVSQGLFGFEGRLAFGKFCTFTDLD